MKTKDRKDMFTKTDKELKKILLDAKDSLFNLRIDLSQNKLKNTTSIVLKRKEIALILTVLRQKEFENAKNT
ncbi:MAG: 50S ribosomal protein L29 [Candidatus Levybacteria bacterium GW2011_GWB1_35_5]|nr:MAG: 50S ribosomal protein L29 [Candidatus Levybacteria bacterium GW2011_GWB1_35_5]